LTAFVLDGRPVARAMRERARGELTRFQNAYGFSPGLAVVIIGSDPSARAYLGAIMKAAGTVDMTVHVVELNATIEQSRLNAAIDDLNQRTDVQGFLILQPLPPHLSRVEVSDLVDPRKDIDGITTFNAGRLFHDDRDVLAPSTPAGGMALLKHYEIPIAGQYAVVVGRSPVVGRPMAAMLTAADATVTTCHSRTREIARFTRDADIVVSAAGRPDVITGNMVKPGATVIDFGVNFVEGRMVGDVDHASVEPIAGALTPVPGGTGRVTTSILLRNTIKAATIQVRALAASSGTLDAVLMGEFS
jgi:methylenetetrahydrofolate dehydrogenase (NADP+) / methenyltetrahydrofolate cyclohydrolase